jgi:hypothetical protein
MAFDLIVSLLVFVIVGLVLFAVIYFPVVYGSKSSKPPANSVGLREFTANAGGPGQERPWCVTTRYSIAYVLSDGFQGPWSDFSGDVFSLSQTFPLIGLAPPPDPTWDVIVQRLDGAASEPHPIAPQWQPRDPEGWSFVDTDNPCTVTYEPPQPTGYPTPVGADPYLPTWDVTVPPGAPWCVGTRYRSIFLAADNKHSAFTGWSVIQWRSMDNSLPTFRVAPPPAEHASLWTYWVPSHIALPAGPSLSFTIFRASERETFAIPWPFQSTKSTPDYVVEYTTAVFRRLGVNLEFNFDSGSENCYGFLHVDGTSPGVTAVQLLGRTNDILTPLGFREQTIPLDDYVEAVETVDFLYTVEHNNVFVPEFRCDPNEIQVDRTNLCTEADVPQPDAPSAGRFTVDLADPSQTRQ